MKKEISIIAALLILVGTMGVFADSAPTQNVAAEIVQETIDISVNNINYGTIFPGNEVYRNSSVTVSDANNVNLTVTIQVTNPGVGNLFYHIWFDVESDGFSNDAEINNGTETLNLNDIPWSPVAPSSYTHTLPTKLVVPQGFAAGQINGIVTYTAMKRV